MRYDLKKMHAHESGFTMIELLVVIAIMAILSTTGFIFLGNFSANNNLKKVLSEVEAVADATQKRSMTQDAGKRWNIRFTNSTSSGSQYIVFSGTSYATSSVDRTYALAHNVQFSEPSVGNSFDALFAPLTGALPSRKIVSMVTGKGDGFVGDLIFNTSGLVTKRADSGFAGYWHFDEGTGVTAFDASGMGNNGVLVNSPTWQSGSNCEAGGCLSFNGVNNYINASSSSFKFGTGNFSVSMWVYPTSFASEAGLYDSLILGGVGARTNAFVLVQTASTGNLRLFSQNAYTLSTSKSLSLNTWNHIVIVRSGATVTFYINGLSDPTTVTLSTNITSGGAVLGRYSDVSGGYFSGRIDEVHIYGRALSAVEVTNMYSDLK